MRRTVSVSLLLVACTLGLLLVTGHTKAQAGPHVELFVTSWCPYCAKAEAYFRTKGIAYTAYDIEKDPNAAKRFQRYGERGVPLVVINGTAIAGYAVDAYEAALRVQQTAPSHAAPAASGRQ